MALFHRDINKRLAKHIHQLEKFGFLPDDWVWDRKRILELEVIDERLIDDLVKLHRKHKGVPDLFHNLEPLVFEMHNDIEAILHTTIVEKGEGKREKVETLVFEKAKEDKEKIERLIREIQKLFSEDNLRILQLIRSKIIDITRDGTCIHMFNLADIESIWSEGIRSGGVVRLGYSRRLGRNITLSDVRRGNEELFGYFGGSSPESISSDGIITAYNAAKFTKKDLVHFSNERRLNIKRKERANLRRLVRKYQDLEDGDEINDNRDRAFLKFVMRSDNRTDHKYWNCGLVINPKYVRNATHFMRMPNEGSIIPGRFQDQVLGIFLQGATYIEMVMYRMFKITKNTPEERIPVYLPNGKVAWPK